MAATEVILHRAAVREYRGAIQWYKERSPATVNRFCVAVDEAIDRIAAGPEAFPVTARKYRWIRVRRFPYMLVFRDFAPGVVMVVAIAHTSRRPGYWRRRA